ncbi:MAG: hypothetical protein Q7O12_00550 [Deltaproteobacteria bacterium]|nr:hypothetical protein [Deltaproteobacteria bacterium]
MQNINKICLMILVGLIAPIMLSGCIKIGSAMLMGGKVVKGYVPQKILVAYEARGTFPAGSQYYLIETGSGPAFCRKDIDGIAMICKKHWVEGDADYFSAALFGFGPAYIYKVPIDRSKNAEGYVYADRTYTGTPGDRLRPMPNEPKEKPDVVLIPKKM